MKELYILYDIGEDKVLYATYDIQKMYAHVGEIAVKRGLYSQNIFVINVDMDKVDMDKVDA